MSQSIKSFSKSLVSAADLSAKAFFIGKVDSNGKLALASAATDAIVGVIEDGSLGSGASASYQFVGTAKVKAGGTITVGAYVTSDSSGQAVATTTNGNVVLGRYIGTASAASGDIIEVQLGIHKAWFA